MKYTIIVSRQFQKSLQRYARAGKRWIIVYVSEVSDLLKMQDVQSSLVLRDVWRDHPLKGDKGGFRELHLGMDDLLIYQVDDELQRIELIDIIDHEQLRKRW